MKFISRVIFVSLTLVATAQSAVTSYTSQSSFNLSSVGLLGFDFDGIASAGEAPFFPAGVTRGPVTFSATSSFVIDSGNGQGNPVPVFSGQSPNSTPNPVTATLSGATAIGFFYGSYLASGLSFTATVTAGSDASFSLALPSVINNYKFVGFTSNTPITKVVFNSSVDSVDINAFDVAFFQVGSIAAPIPEPSIALMFGVGLALLGAIGKRRRA